MRSFLKALIVLHRTYGSLRLRARAHVLIRFLTCPFLRVLAALPPGTRSLLEVGSGHGVFARLAAARGVGRVVAIEPDIRKVMSIRRVRGISIVAGFDQSVRGTFDAIAMIDVLYLVPQDEWDRLLTRSRERLATGGVLIVKEMDPEARLKNGWNRLQEWLSINILRITLGGRVSFEPSAAFRSRLERLGFVDVKAQRIDLGYPHPHLLYTARVETFGAPTP